MIKIKQITFSTCEDSEGLYGLSEDGLLYLWTYQKVKVEESEVMELQKTEKVTKGTDEWFVRRYGWVLQEDQLNK